MDYIGVLPDAVLQFVVGKVQAATLDLAGAAATAKLLSQSLVEGSVGGGSSRTLPQ